MNELHHDLPLGRPPKTNGARKGAAKRARTRRGHLAETLSEARQDKGLELRDLSVITGVRMTYLEALEAGDYGRLPEDAKGKSAVRLYARAVGLDPARMLLLYTQERRGVYTPPPPELELPRDDARAPRPMWGRLGRWLATLALVAATLGGALWAFNTLLFPPTSPPLTETAPTVSVPEKSEALSPTPPPSTPVNLSTADVPVRPPPTLPPTAGQRPAEAQLEAGAASLGAPAAGTVPSTPETTPVPTETSEPATAQPTRPEPLETNPRQPDTAPAPASETVPEVSEPEVAAPEPAAPEAAAADSAPPQSAAPAPPAGLTLNVTTPAWLEVYTGSARREGERLVYRLAEPGETWTFELPVFIFTGNAGGLTVSVAGAPAAPLGPADAVVGRAFPAE